MKILLWKIGALGDVLMTTPLVRQLRRSFPQAKIDYLVGQSSEVVLRGNPHLDTIHAFDERILYDKQLRLVPGIVQRLRPYDVVLVLDKHWVFSAIAAAARVPTRVGFVRTQIEGLLHTVKLPYGEIRHEIQYYLQLGEMLGMQADFSDVQFELPDASPFEIQAPYTVIVNSGGAHVFERSSVRRLPSPLFSELVRECSRRARVVFLGSAAERAEYEQDASPTAINLCGKTNLRQAWGVLQNAQAVFTTDTGLMHMAAAVNNNVTAIFGPTHPARKCPPGARWVWTDENAYDDRYELFGTVPRRSYFTSMTVRDILNPGNTGPKRAIND